MLIEYLNFHIKCHDEFRGKDHDMKIYDLFIIIILFGIFLILAIKDQQVPKRHKNRNKVKIEFPKLNLIE